MILYGLLYVQVWDQDLEILAREATACTFTRGPRTEPDSKVEDGNLIEIATGVTDPDVFISNAFSAWAAQGTEFNFDTQTCNSQDHDCEHFIQVN